MFVLQISSIYVTFDQKKEIEKNTRDTRMELGK